MELCTIAVMIEIKTDLFMPGSLLTLLNLVPEVHRWVPHPGDWGPMTPSARRAFPSVHLFLDDRLGPVWSETWG